ncbi:MAG: energy-coupling factor ABC transporter ATP-binding protein [Methanoregula sp.]|jgi:energy-coupling factor transport system ATP-binding protein
MRLHLNATRACRGDWSLAAHGTFCEGMHLVSGDVGSGKSTLALMMAGLLSPGEGSIVREGVSSSMISLQFPEYHVTGSTVAEECRSWGLDSESVLCNVNLMDKRNVAPLTLSRGELKRLHLACVLAKQYDLLLLDEPFSSLDAREKERVCEHLSRRTGGITILFTHEQAIFPRVDQTWEIEQGVLIDRGELPDALSRWAHAPVLINKMIASGKDLKNISPLDLQEAVCRT